MLRAGIDIGGTFTDVTLLDGEAGALRTHKVLTTSADPAAGAFDGLDELLGRVDRSFADVDEVIHGTTLVSNTIIERDGARTGLLATAGTRDVLNIRRSFRFDLYDWDVEEPSPLVPRNRRLEVDERLDSDGAVVEPLDGGEVETAVRTLVEQHGVESIAVCLLHAYASDVHEREIERLIAAEYPSVDTSLSSTVAPILREYERTSTTVVNAYVKPAIDAYLETLEDALRSAGFRGGLYLMTSEGGVVGTETARREPVRLVSSGPAAGLLLSAGVGRDRRTSDLLSFDMGGTTAKGGIVRDGQVSIAYEDDVARTHQFKEGSGYTVAVPLVELSEIGAGGGSIAAVDEVGLVDVGPRSSGADPGPVCYGRGGDEPTVTDAALFLGYLDAERPLGGEIRLEPARAAEVFDEQIADPLDLERERAAWEVYEVVTENMANAFRRHATEQGVDPSELALVAQGGAGPMTAFRVAERLGLDEVVCPMGAGVGSAIGLVEAPKKYENARTERHVLGTASREELVAVFETLREEAERVLRTADASEDALTVDFSLGMRHVNQGAEIRVGLPVEAADQLSEDLIWRRFRERYRTLYNRAALDAPVEILHFRVTLREERTDDGWELRRSTTGGIRRTEDAYFGDAGWVETDVRSWSTLEPGQTYTGSAIVHTEQTSVVIDPASTYTLEDNHLILRR